MAYVIAITGPSGVGKTTLANLIASRYGGVLILSGDNFHKWQRNSPYWTKYTHFNPEANNLEEAAKMIKSLSAGEPTWVPQYNHSTGKFDKPVCISPKKIIIYEGLHAFSADVDFKVYVDTDEALTKEWKIARDTSKRGYTQGQAEKQIEKRRADYLKFILPQREQADLILKFSQKDGRVVLNVLTHDWHYLEKGFAQLQAFLDIANHLASDLSLIQGAGGNFSVKDGNRVIIKSSGAHISKVTPTEGFVVCRRFDSHHTKNEKQYEKTLKDSLYYGAGRPSMEFGFHSLLEAPVVVHTHPLAVNTLLCSEQGLPTLSGLFKDFTWIPYTAPGHKLYNRILNEKVSKIYFLENHGLIVTGKSAKQALALTDKINAKCQKWIDNNSISNHQVLKGGPLYPDAVIFPDESKEVNDFLEESIRNCRLTPKFLTDKQRKEVSNLTLEKHRKS